MSRERIFGTDGIRGLAGVGKLSPEVVVRVGKALAVIAREQGRASPRVLIGRDTRASGPMLEAALSAGLLAGGARPISGGVLPTPAVALVTQRRRHDLGVVISASHNPYHDNGIKIFGPDATKLSDALEDRIETLVMDGEMGALAEPAQPAEMDDAAEIYIDLVLDSLERMPRLDGMRIVVDCANGAAWHTAPETLRRLGAEVIPIHASPNGRNINRGCGALHTSAAAHAVRKHKATLGLSLDGDADRAMLTDETGRLQDGDTILFVLARNLLANGRLPDATVVGTVMTNVGLERAFTEHGLHLIRTPVGDRHVAALMQAGGFGLGGEPSGHVLVTGRGQPMIGDGLITGLLVMRALSENGVTLSAAAEGFERAPQALVNVRVREKPRLKNVKPLQKAASAVERKLGDRGRVLLRYSGTEPLARVMVEGPGALTHARSIARVLAAEIGVEESDGKDHP
jgi:phosphoglucosamine mutase